MRVVAELDVAQRQLALALDEDLLRPVDQDVGDRVVGQQRLQRAEPQHVVDQDRDQVTLLGQVDPQAQLIANDGDDLGDLPGQLAARQIGRRGDVDPLQQQRLDDVLGFLDRGRGGMAFGKGLVLAGFEVVGRVEGAQRRFRLGFAILGLGPRRGGEPRGIDRYRLWLRRFLPGIGRCAVQQRTKHRGHQLADFDAAGRQASRLLGLDDDVPDRDRHVAPW